VILEGRFFVDLRFGGAGNVIAAIRSQTIVICDR